MLGGGLTTVTPAAAALAAPQTQAAEAELSRPDVLGAQLAARVEQRRVEVADLATETSTTWANPGGTLSTEYADGPVRVRDGDGWKPVDSTLAAVDGGFSPRVSPNPMVFSGGGSGPVASLTAGQGELGVGFASALSALPAPTVSGATATYANVAPNVDLVLTSGVGGFELTAVLKARPSKPVSFTLPLARKGLTVEPIGGGGFALLDATGTQVARIAPALMWDSAQPGASAQLPGGNGLMRPVEVTLDAAGHLTVTPDAAFLADPATVYPVYVDPTATATLHADTWVQSGVYADKNYNGSNEFRVGKDPAGMADRAFIKFDMPPLTGKHILNATFKAYNFYSPSCTAATVKVHQTATNWDPATLTWNTMPTVYSGDTGSNSSYARGFSSSCPANWQDTPVTGLVENWVNQNVANFGFRMSADEASANSYKRFYSHFYSASLGPKLTIEYNSYPNTVGGESMSPSNVFTDEAGVTTTYATSTTPTFFGGASDADGGNVKIRVQVIDSAGSVVADLTSPSVPAGGITSVKAPAGALVNGGTYSWRAIAHDGIDYSKSWRQLGTFTVDTTAPAAPAITLPSPYVADGWSGSNPAGSFTFTRASADSDAREYVWRPDDGQTGATAVTSTSNTQTITPSAGWRTLTVETVDQAGNRSPATSVSFGAGAAVTSPATGASTQRYARLKAIAAPGSSNVSWSYRLTASDAWAPLPLSGNAVTYATTGAAVTGWPVPAVATATSSTSPQLLLDLHQVLVGSGGEVRDGALQLQAAFTGTVSSTTANDPTVSLDQNAFSSDATEQIGPGSVSLLTGNLSVTATDASIDSYGSDLTLSRTFNSRTADKPGLFGPGWLASLTVEEAGSSFTELSDTGSSVTVTDASGGSLIFAKTGAGGTYLAQGDAEGLVLKTSGDTATGPSAFTVSDDAGTVTTFAVATTWAAAPSLSAPHNYPITSVAQAADPSATTYSYSSGRPTRMLAPHPTGANCNTTWQLGCRALDLSYTSVNGVQQIAKATLRTFDGTGADQAVDVACFTYDSAGRLVQAWDPRISARTCGTPVLATSYSYDSTGRLASLTPPGLAPWTLAYDGTGLAARLSSVTRTHNSSHGGGSQTSTVRYDIPLGNDTDAGSGLHPDLSPAAVAAWAQTDLPVTATAVFGPGDSVPAFPYVAGADFRDGAITAMNADGRVVNTAAYSGTGQAGWRIDTAEHDDAGRPIRTLTAGNRDRALRRPDAGSVTVPLPSDSAEAARQLSTVQLYARNPNDPDPQQAEQLDLTETFGPLHSVVLPNGSTAPAREHTRLTYDTGTENGHPAGGSLRLVMTSTTSASLSAAPAATALTDSRTTRNDYALGSEQHYWNLRTPVRTNSYAVHGDDTTAVRTTAILDPTGLVVENRMPSDTSGANAGTTLSTYYTAGTTNNAGCVNTAWTKLLCRTEPKAQPGVTGLPGLVTTHYTYDYLLRPTVVTETAADNNGTGTPVNRTTTTTYRTGGLSPQVDTVALTGGVGTAVPTVTYAYHPDSGLPTTTSAPGTGTPLTTSYDDFARTTSFTDADGATSTTSYDSRGRVASTSNPKGTTTYGYDTTSIVTDGTERRGLLTSASTTGLGGAFTAVYDGGGQLRTHTYPNSITAAYTSDETGDTTSLTYSKQNITWFTDSQTSNIHGQWRSHTGLPSSQTYTYDGLGRLTQAADTSSTGSGCITRRYAFAGTPGLNSNRSNLTSYNPNTDGTCQTSTATTSTAYSYDSADRLQPTGTATDLTYDTYGRTTTLPAALAGGTTVTNGFYTNDLVNSQTAGTHTKTWQLDATLQRFRTFTDNATGTTITKTNHYDDPSSDSPSWIDEGNSTSTRYTTGLDGNLAATTTLSSTDTITDLHYQLTNLHGDLVTTTTATASTYDGAVLDNDEYGNPKTTIRTRYGWLGGKQRSTDTLAGLTLMGVRLYNPTLGRFLSVDPVVGGNANVYTYPNDPINIFDLDGRVAAKRWLNKVRRGMRRFGDGLGVSFEAGGGLGQGALIGAGWNKYDRFGAYAYTTGDKRGYMWGASLGASITWQRGRAARKQRCWSAGAISSCGPRRGYRGARTFSIFAPAVKFPALFGPYGDR